ncbi:hypothetical protein NEAUS06_1886 [Nematocida ausubeli]|nr:hypothetical protein NEAUS06_1886 [Nematocida ausubeli]
MNTTEKDSTTLKPKRTCKYNIEDKLDYYAALKRTFTKHQYILNNLNKNNQLKELASNIFIIRAIHELSQNEKKDMLDTDELTGNRMIKAFNDTVNIIDDLSMVEHVLASQEAIDKYYEFLNTYHLSEMLRIPDVFEFLLYDMRTGLKDQPDRGNIKNNNVFSYKYLFAKDKEARSILSIAIEAIRKYGGNLAISNERGEVVPNLKNIPITEKEIFCLQEFLSNTATQTLLSPIQYLEESILIKTRDNSGYRGFKPFIGELFSFLRPDGPPVCIDTLLTQMCNMAEILKRFNDDGDNAVFEWYMHSYIPKIHNHLICTANQMEICSYKERMENCLITMAEKVKEGGLIGRSKNDPSFLHIFIGKLEERVAFAAHIISRFARFIYNMDLLLLIFLICIILCICSVVLICIYPEVLQRSYIGQ